MQQCLAQHATSSVRCATRNMQGRARRDDSARIQPHRMEVSCLGADLTLPNARAFDVFLAPFDRPVGPAMLRAFVSFVCLFACLFVCLQVFAMFVAALGHDIDHPGMNNSFEVPTTPRPLTPHCRTVHCSERYGVQCSGPIGTGPLWSQSNRYSH